MRRGIFTVLLSGLLLSGCANNDMNDLSVFVDEMRARKPAPIDPLPEFRQAETFLYVPAGRRDPFAPPPLETDEDIDVVVTDGPSPDLTRPREELESFPLDTLRMVGVLEQQEDMWGLIRANDGTIHRVRAGNYLGQNHGKILVINEQSVDLIELIPTGRGGYLEREAALGLSGQ